VREAKITHDEWWQAIDFLTRAGKMCSDNRQEFILLSDILGISMLVDAIDHVGGPGISESTVLGPFYAGQQRELAAGESILLREEESTPLEMRGRVTDSEGRPIANALVEVWQTAPNQLYDVQDEDQPEGHLRASFRTDGAGTYRFRTIMPVSYPIPNDGPAGQLLAAMGRHPFRPAHIHFMISAPGYRTLVTHLFLDGDKYLESDAVFGVKPSLIIRPTRIEGVNTARRVPVRCTFFNYEVKVALAPTLSSSCPIMQSCIVHCKCPRTTSISIRPRILRTSASRSADRSSLASG
jgi:protocatechuate 3,4-dioxygenase beta subunit